MHDLRAWDESWDQTAVRPYHDPMGRAASGHLEQLPSGSFRVEVHAGTDPLTGRRLRFRQTVKTEKQARIMLGRLLEQASAGRRPDSGVTVAELLARYMEVAELDVSTRQTYEGYLRRTVLPALGSMELRKLRGPVLDTFYARLRRCGDLACAGRSPSTGTFQPWRSSRVMPVRPGSRPPVLSAMRSPPASWERGTSSRRCGNWPPLLGCRRQQYVASSRYWLMRDSSQPSKADAR